MDIDAQVAVKQKEPQALPPQPQSPSAAAPAGAADPSSSEQLPADGQAQAASKRSDASAADTANNGANGRITRSSRRNDQPIQSEPAQDVSLLPLKTPILLALKMPAVVQHHPLPPDPRATLASAGSSTSTPTTPTSSIMETEVAAVAAAARRETDSSSFRLLTDADSFGRARHLPGVEYDTSDAYYLKLHKFSETLEKRATRIEREKLSVERARLITELEELRGKSWLFSSRSVGGSGSPSNSKGMPSGTVAGSRAEAERRRRIVELEDRLRRYDMLLPAAGTRRSLTSSAAANAHKSATPPPSAAAAVAAGAKAFPAASTSSPAAGVKATSPNGRSITITYKALDKAQASGTGPRGRQGSKLRQSYGGEDSSDDLDSDDDYGPPTKRANKGSSRPSTSYMWSSIHYTAPRQPKRKVQAGLGATLLDPEEERKRPRSLYAIDSFFRSEALRKSVRESSRPGRRSSSRVAYAFGARLPEQQLALPDEFHLHGGASGFDPQERSLDQIARERIGGSSAVPGMTVRGVSVPDSAMAAIAGPSTLENSNTAVVNASAATAPGPASQPVPTVASQPTPIAATGPRFVPAAAEEPALAEPAPTSAAAPAPVLEPLANVPDSTTAEVPETTPAESLPT